MRMTFLREKILKKIGGEMNGKKNGRKSRSFNDIGLL